MLRAVLFFVVEICNLCLVPQDEKEFKQHSTYNGKKYYRKQCMSCLNKRHALYRAKRRISYPEVELLNAAKRRAKKNGIEFNLSIEDIVIPEHCPILGILLFSKRGKSNERGPHDNSPTLDRIDPYKGYVKGNCCVISHKANRMKQDNTLEDLLKIVSYIQKSQMNGVENEQESV